MVRTLIGVRGTFARGLIASATSPRDTTSVELRWILEVNKPQPVVLFEVIKGRVTGTAPDIGEMHHVQK